MKQLDINGLKTITFNLEKKYFEQIKSGLKTEEYREKKTFWTKRLVNRHFDVVIIKMGYPKKGQDEGKVLYFKWKGYSEKKIKHEVFNDQTVDVYAIDLSEPFY